MLAYNLHINCMKRKLLERRDRQNGRATSLVSNEDWEGLSIGVNTTLLVSKSIQENRKMAKRTARITKRQQETNLVRILVLVLTLNFLSYLFLAESTTRKITGKLKGILGRSRDGADPKRGGVTGSKPTYAAATVAGGNNAAGSGSKSRQGRTPETPGGGSRDSDVYEYQGYTAVSRSPPQGAQSPQSPRSPRSPRDQDYGPPQSSRVPASPTSASFRRNIQDGQDNDYRRKMNDESRDDAGYQYAPTEPDYDYRTLD